MRQESTTYVNSSSLSLKPNLPPIIDSFLKKHKSENLILIDSLLGLSKLFSVVNIFQYLQLFSADVESICEC